MSGPLATPLRTKAPWRVLAGFGGAKHAACRFAAPETVDELAATLEAAKSEGLTVGFRGSGRSYGDAALNREGLVIDATRINRMLRWEPEAGVFEAEGGMTIEGLWRRTVEDGYWPAVVPGTMHPTLAGCAAMNIHGKNNFRVGSFGEHILELDLLTPSGELLTLSPAERPELFRAVIGGMGLLGAITRLKLKLKRVHSGRLSVNSITTRNLEELFDAFEANLHEDYAVAWVDCTAQGRGLGRAQIHTARYLEPGEDPEAQATLHVERQGLPGHILGVPKSALWRVMRLFTNNLGVQLTNFAKYYSSWLSHEKRYLQSHVGFAFLLDYVPNWRLAYGPGGLIQYQVFVPYGTARECLKDVLTMCQRAGQPSYLGVLKRHRPDDFALSYALDGWSLAMDFRVTPTRQRALWELTERLTERVLAAGGKFYFAKDSVLSPANVEQAYGRERLEHFAALKQELDPQGLLTTDLWRRAVAPVATLSAPLIAPSTEAAAVSL